MGQFIATVDGGNVDVQDNEVDVEIIPGKLTDVSFLPARAQEECVNGYQWMAVTSRKSGGHFICFSVAGNVLDPKIISYETK